MTNLFSEKLEHSLKVIEMGVIPKLKAIAQNRTDEKTRAAVFWAVGNIAGELKPNLRDMIMEAGFFELAKEILDTKLDGIVKKEYVDNLGFLIGNLARTMPQLPKTVTNKIIPGICAAIKKWINDNELMTNFLWALFYLLAGSDASTITEIIELGMVPVLINFMKPGYDVQIFLPAMRCIGNIASSNNEHTQILLDNGILSVLDNGLTISKKKSINKELCWIISNITAGNQSQVEAVLECGLYEKVLNIAGNKNENYEIRKEAFYVIFNASSVPLKEKYIDLMINKSMPILVKNGLEDISVKSDILRIILETISFYFVLLDHKEKISEYLKKENAIDKINKIKETKAPELYEIACHILDEIANSDDKMDDIKEDSDINMENLKI